MTKLRAHIPPSEDLRRLCLLAPLLLGALATAAAYLQLSPWARRQSMPTLVVAVWATLSVGPILGILLWRAGPWMKYRAGVATIEGDGIRIQGTFASRFLRWADIGAFQILRANGAAFALLSPAGAGASWILELDRDNEGPLVGSLNTNCATGSRVDLRLPYVEDRAGARRRVSCVVAGAALAILTTLFARSGSTIAWPLALACLPLPFVSVGYLVRLLSQHPTWATLHIEGDASHFLLPDRGRIVSTQIDLNALVNNPMIDDPSGAKGRRFALPEGSLSRGTQLSLIKQFLPRGPS